ncbi:MAG: ATP-binding protein [Candidatus Aenigmatarchaeota archaeon]
MQNSKKYVICGAPCSGKSTLISELSKRGFRTVDEAARIIINQGISEGKTVEEVRSNPLEHQRKVTKLKVELEESLPEDEICFLDTGIPDSIAYYRLHGLDIGELLEICRKAAYKKVFFLELFDYKRDYARLENKETAEKLSELIKNAYKEMGHEIVIVPRMHVKERADFILSNL